MLHTYVPIGIKNGQNWNSSKERTIMPTNGTNKCLYIFAYVNTFLYLCVLNKNIIEPLEVAHDTNKVHTIMTTTNQTNITFVNQMCAVMAAQAMQLLAIHNGYHCEFEFWTYETGSSAHIHVSIFSEDGNIEIPNGYLYSQHTQMYLEDSKLYVHGFDFNY